MSNSYCPKCCHAIAGKDIASNDKLCGNVESDIAGDFVATPSPMGTYVGKFFKSKGCYGLA